jgi:MerR family transcriptional regulator/heat shock protein HspR
MPRGRRTSEPAEGRDEARSAPGRGKYYMISVVAKSYGIHPTEGNTRLYSEDDLRQLEVILNLTRDLGVNLAGVEIVLNMRRKMEQMQQEFGEFLQQLREELHKSRGEGLEEKIEQALVKLPPAYIVRSAVLEKVRE